MLKNEEEFKKLVDSLNINTKPNPVHQSKLRWQMLSIFNKTQQKRSPRAHLVQAIWRTIMDRKIIKSVAAAVIVLALVLGITLLTSKVREQNRKTAIQQAQQQKKNEPIQPDQYKLKQTIQQQTAAKLKKEKQQIEQLFAAGNIEGLVKMLGQGQYQSKILAANYLAQIGDANAVEPLENLSRQWGQDQTENPFATAISEIQQRIASEQQQVAQTEANDVTALTAETNDVLDFFVVQKETKQPLQDVALNIKIQREGPDDKYEDFTDQQGLCRIVYGPEPTKYVSVTVHKENFVPMQAYFRTEDGGIPQNYTIALEPAVSIGGIVQNEQGQPIEAASVNIDRYSEGEYEKKSWISIRDYVVKTDKDGKWSCNVMPKALGRFGITLSHPEYADDVYARNWRGLDLDKLQAGTCVMIMKRGVILSGFVFDQMGRPIQGASVLRGDSHYVADKMKTKTDAQGRFDFGRVDMGLEILTAQAEGYAPDMKQISIRQDIGPVEFVLEPGYTIAGRVIDVNGNPVAQASVSADEWRGNRTLDWNTKTNESGRFVWESAPPDKVRIGVYKSKYMSSREDVKTRDQEYEIVLAPQLTVYGNVTDAETGRPIDKFTATKGIQWQNNDSVSWQSGSYSVKDCSGGKYNMEFNSPYPGHLIRIDAEGYLPAVSRVFSDDEGKVRFDFVLKKGEGPYGTVYLPDGKPASGAEVVTVTKGKWATFENGKLLDKRQGVSVVTRNDGSFQLTPQTEPYKLVVIHDQGVAEVMEDEFLASPEIYLEKWGRVEGTLYIGSRPAAGERIYMYTQQTSNDPMGCNFQFSYNVTTDEQGNFVIERVMPGQLKISKAVLSEDGRRTTYSNWKNIEVAAGQITYVVIGGEGRTVFGKLTKPSIVAPDWQWYCTTANISTAGISEERTKAMARIYKEVELPLPAGFEQMSYNETMEWFKKWTTSEQGLALQQQIQQRVKEELGDYEQKHYGIQIQPDGSFRVDNVTQGDYVMQVTFMGMGPRVGECDYRNRLGTGKFRFTMPQVTEQNIDEPLDLGLIQLEMDSKAKVGQFAPDFTLKTLDGQQVSLADYRGRHLLLNFWMIQMQPDGNEQMEKIRDLYQLYQNDERFAVLSITATGNIDLFTEIVKKYLAEKEITWKQGLVSFENQELAQSYGVRTYPCNVLIDPNGKIIATGITADELESKLAELLQ